MVKISSLEKISKEIFALYDSLFDIELEEGINSERYKDTLESLKVLISLENSLYDKVIEEELEILYKNLAIYTESKGEVGNKKIIEGYEVEEVYIDQEKVDVITRITNKIDKRANDIFGYKITATYTGIPLYNKFADKEDDECYSIEIINMYFDLATIIYSENDKNISKENRIYTKYDYSKISYLDENLMLAYDFDISRLNEEKIYNYMNLLRRNKDFNNYFIEHLLTSSKEFSNLMDEEEEEAMFDRDYYETTYIKYFYLLKAILSVSDEELYNKIKNHLIKYINNDTLTSYKIKELFENEKQYVKTKKNSQIM